MSESPVYVPPFVRASRDLGVPLSAARAADDELDDDVDGERDGESDATAGPASRGGEGERRDLPGARVAIREGLPPSYRMRHEPHYVEALIDRSFEPVTATVTAAATETATAAAPATAPHPVAPSTSTLIPTPTLTPTSVPSPSPALAASAPLAAAAASLAEAFDAIQAALRDLPLRGRPLRDRVAIELARAEATRGRWLADAAVVLQSEPLPALDEVDLLHLLAEVFEALGPEQRLSGGAAALPLPAGVCPVFGDERLLTTALGAMLAAVHALIADRGDARKVSVALGPRREAATRTIEVCQTAVRLPAPAYARFFDAAWADHPAGAPGALLLAAAKRIALAHGGALDIVPLDGGGCRLVLGVPAAD